MIIIKTEEEIKTMREGGYKLGKILQKLGRMVEPDVTTGQLEKEANRMIKEVGGISAFKNYLPGGSYAPYPTTLCTSINSEIVHAPAEPSRKLVEGDIIGIDIGMKYPAKKGMFTDTAITVAVGEISDKAKKLIEVTKKSLELAIKQVKPGNTLNDIGNAVQSYAESFKYSVVRDLVGHGVGQEVHEEPQVPNFKIVDGSLKNVVLKPGMTIAIEPMINIGGHRVVSDDDGFSISTYDNSLSAHFEHTVAVVEDGCIIITKA